MEKLECSDLDQICYICDRKTKDELPEGKLYKRDNLVVHHFCLLFASALVQNGEDDEGILGFLNPDIRKEKNRGKKLNCFYCKKKGATVGCLDTKCKRSYHFPCGLYHGALYQFSDTFPSYCHTHRLLQAPPTGKKEVPTSCGVCFESIEGQEKEKKSKKKKEKEEKEEKFDICVETVWSPCCSGLFHVNCIRRLACTAGYFFKCPLCNCKDGFEEEMKKFGVFVPEQDASWETEPSAYSGLLERYGKCDAAECLCEEGREKDIQDTAYEIILCSSCGSAGVHIDCGKLKLSSPEYVCSSCTLPSSQPSSRLPRSRTRGENIPKKLEITKNVRNPSPPKNPRKILCSHPRLVPEGENVSRPTTPVQSEGTAKPRTETSPSPSTSSTPSTSSSASTSSPSLTSSDVDTSVSNSSFNTPFSSSTPKSPVPAPTPLNRSVSAPSTPIRKSGGLERRPPGPSSNPGTPTSRDLPKTIWNRSSSQTPIIGSSPSPRTSKELKKTANKKFGNGTLRIFLQKNKNVKIVKLVKVKLDVTAPNILNLKSLDDIDSDASAKKKKKKEVKSKPLSTPKLAVDKIDLNESSLNEKSKEQNKLPSINVIESSLKVKLGNFAPKINDKVKSTRIKKYLPALRYLKPKRLPKHQRSARLPFTERREDNSKDTFKPELQTVAEKAENAEIDDEIMNIVHRISFDEDEMVSPTISRSPSPTPNTRINTTPSITTPIFGIPVPTSPRIPTPTASIEIPIPTASSGKPTPTYGKPTSTPTSDRRPSTPTPSPSIPTPTPRTHTSSPAPSTSTTQNTSSLNTSTDSSSSSNSSSSDTSSSSIPTPSSKPTPNTSSMPTPNTSSIPTPNTSSIPTPNTSSIPTPNTSSVEPEADSATSLNSKYITAIGSKTASATELGLNPEVTKLQKEIKTQAENRVLIKVIKDSEQSFLELEEYLEMIPRMREIETKSPIISDLLRLKRRRESAFEAMNKKQRTDSGDLANNTAEHLQDITDKELVTDDPMIDIQPEVSKEQPHETIHPGEDFDILGSKNHEDKLKQSTPTSNPSKPRSKRSLTQDFVSSFPSSSKEHLSKLKDSKCIQDLSTSKKVCKSSQSSSEWSRTDSAEKMSLPDDRKDVSTLTVREETTSEPKSKKSWTKSIENMSIIEPTEKCSSTKPSEKNSSPLSEQNRVITKPVVDTSEAKPSEERLASKPIDCEITSESSKVTSMPSEGVKFTPKLSERSKSQSKPSERLKSTSKPSDERSKSTSKPIDDSLKSPSKPFKGCSITKKNKTLICNSSGIDASKIVMDSSNVRNEQYGESKISENIFVQPQPYTPNANSSADITDVSADNHFVTVPDSNLLLPVFATAPSLAINSPSPSLLVGPIVPVLPYVSHVPFMYVPIESQNDTQSLISSMPILPRIPDPELMDPATINSLVTNDSSPDTSLNQLDETQTKKPKRPRLLIYSKKPKDSSKMDKSSENLIIPAPKCKSEEISPNTSQTSDVKVPLSGLKTDLKSGNDPPRLKISFRKDIFNDNHIFKESPGKLERNLCSEESYVGLPNFILDSGMTPDQKIEADDSLTNPNTTEVKGGRKQSSGRLGDKRYFMTRILTSMNKLARNPLLNRPLAFKSFTFDATPLIRMRRLEDHGVRRKSKKVLNDVTNCNEDRRLGLNRPKLFKSRGGERKNQLWKSSKINSRIKTMISKNGTIQMIVDKSGEDQKDDANVSKYFKIRNHASSSSSSQSTSPPIKLTIPRSRLTEITSPKLVLKISKRKLKKLKKHKSKKTKKEKKNIPKTMKVKYKNKYGRVIEYAKNLQPEEKF